MSRARELLRQAAQDFADRIYELLRTELLDELRRERSVGATAPQPQDVDRAPSPSSSSPSSSSALESVAGDETLEPEAVAPEVEPARPAAAAAPTGAIAQVLAYVRAHPGVQPAKLLSALKFSRNTVFDALRDATERGWLRKDGRGRGVTYYPSPEAPARDVAARESPRRRSRSAPDLVDRIAAFVAEHPGCRYGEIETATGATKGMLQNALRAAKERGRVRMEGTRVKARYFPVAEAAPAPITPEQQGQHELEPPEAVEVATPEPPPPIATRPLERAPHTPTEDRREAERLLAELEEALRGDMHPVRLVLVLQAIVAELRILQPRIAASEPVAGLLDRAMRTMTAVQRDRQLSYINGLKRTAVADWSLVARRARERLAAFDRDGGISAAAAAPFAEGSARTASVAFRRGGEDRVPGASRPPARRAAPARRRG